MQCVTCSMEVSPNFVAAIAENKCPACGKQLMDSGDYKKIFALKKLLGTLSLGLADPVLVKLSAAISSKFELWPKDMGSAGSEATVAGPLPSAPLTPQEVVADPALMQREKQKIINRVSKAMDAAEADGAELHELEEAGEPDEDADLPPAERARLMREFGLLNDPSEAGNVKDTSPEMVKQLSDLMASETFPLEDEDADRLTRARGLKNQIRAAQGPNKFGIKPLNRIG